MPVTTRILVTNVPGPDSKLVFDFRFGIGGNLSLNAFEFLYRGSESEDSIFVANDVSIDFSQSLGGVDKLIFPKPWSFYRALLNFVWVTGHEG